MLQYNTDGLTAEIDSMDPDVPEEVLLDANKEAEAHTFYMLGSLDTSPDQKLLAYEVDTTGEPMTCCAYYDWLAWEELKINVSHFMGDTCVLCS